jgi:signal transduction histidine kinase
MIDPKLIEILRKVDLFHDAPQNALEQLAPLVTRHEYAQNQLVIRKGDQGDSLFIIASGQVRVHDNEQVVARLEAGNFFGEISFLDTAPRSMSVSADTPSVLYRVTRDNFYKVFRNHPEITQIIVSTLTGRLRTQNENVIRDLRSREAELSKLVEERTHELQESNSELSRTLAELKATQEQLIRQEKLASLGQLTAGIAHEIKNPLNFVNNFARLSLDLVDEIIDADAKTERTEIGGYLRTNLEKIYSHGSRADSIVKGMLEHTRTGTGLSKYPIDINKMCQQVWKQTMDVVRESWPGFECSVTFDLDARLPRVEVSASDFSKMLGNIFNNALHAIREKMKLNVAGYQPVITVSTSLSNNRMLISIKDNGTGMTVEVKNQIFNPFFTTKPTGEGAGLGLSISHDIIVAHGGNIVCESEPGKGSVFVISIPIQEE